MSKAIPQTDEWGVMLRYQDATKRWRRTSRTTRRTIHAAMRAGKAPPSGDVVQVARAGESARVEYPSELRLEQGGSLRVHQHLPRSTPPGVHELRSLGGGPASWLIVTPGACLSPDERAWGWAVQLYALRSGKSWGIGDFADLREFGRGSRQKLGAGFALVNPLGASLPVQPQENSPYFPSSRLFLNPLYLRIEEVPGATASSGQLKKLAAAGRELNQNPLIDRNAVFHLKMRALDHLWSRFKGDTRFDRFCVEQGNLLRQFATFCVLAEQHGAGWSRWPARFRKPASPDLREFAVRHHGRVRFHEWLQWLLDEQLARAARELPLMLDVPIGVNSDGFDAWVWQDLLALEVSVGAPPDEYNTLGQNWGLPPFIPHRLRAAGYEPWRRTLRAMLRHARALRIDHVMGLFRLYWIPRGSDPRAGAYVRYPADELLAVLAIESRRAKAVIVGEDLGTVEKGVRATLHRQNVLSYRLLWFENRPPERYPTGALAAVTTHDLFTTAGLWTGSDLAAQERLGLKPNAQGMQALKRKLRRSAGLADTASPREVILAVHRLLARAPCKLLTATLEDALGVEERPNLPGAAQWPNWSLALPRPLEAILRDDVIQELASVLGDDSLSRAASSSSRSTRRTAR